MNEEELVVHAWGPRPSLRQLTCEVADACAALPLFAVSPLIRPWHRRWGATDEEVHAAMPGDDRVPGCQYVVTRALTIDAPPDAVWPWLVQVGFGKAGFYSRDLLDNFGHPSADRIVTEFQHARTGDWVPMFTKVNDTTAFRIAEMVAPVHLLWVKPDSTWAWVLKPEGRGTRLITRIRILYRWRLPADAAFSLFLNEFGDFPMMRKMLLNLKRLAERATDHGEARRLQDVGRTGGR